MPDNSYVIDMEITNDTPAIGMEVGNSARTVDMTVEPGSEYHAITFAMMRTIMNKMTGESFRFTYPDPRDGLVTIKAYVGDRDWEVIMAREAVDPDGKNNDWKKNWFGDLSFSIIEF